MQPLSSAPALQSPREKQRPLWLGTVPRHGQQKLSGGCRDPERSCRVAQQPGCGETGVREVKTLFGFVKKEGKTSPFPAGGLSKFPTAEFILED